MALTFPKTFRFQRSSEFLRVKTAGRAYSGRLMTLGVLKGCEASKAGFITSKRVGGAVERNRVRRRLRELVRLSRAGWVPGIQVVVIARRAAVGASFEHLHREWLTLARRAGMLAPSESQPEGEPRA